LNFAHVKKIRSISPNLIGFKIFLQKWFPEISKGMKFFEDFKPIIKNSERKLEKKLYKGRSHKVKI
jgi:hypothetical protein